MDEHNITNNTEPTRSINEVSSITPFKSGSFPLISTMSKNGMALALILCFIIFGTSYGGIWYWQKQSLSELDNVTKFTPRPAPADLAVDWKTYTNTKYGFEARYPSDWFFIDCDSSYIGFSYVQSKLPPCETDGDQPHVNIKVTSGGASGMDKYIATTEGSINSYSKVTATVGGNIAATKYVGLTNAIDGPGPRDGTQAIEVLFYRDNNIYQVYYYGLDGKDYSQIFDQILSTFKFTDQIGTSNTSTWKTFKDQMGRFEIKYPANAYMDYSADYEQELRRNRVFGFNNVGSSTDPVKTLYFSIYAYPLKQPISCSEAAHGYVNGHEIVGKIKIDDIEYDKCVIDRSEMSEYRDQAISVSFNRNNYTWLIQATTYDINKAVIEEVISTLRLTK